MPLIEAISALATLLGTYQVVRGNKQPGEPAAPSDLAASGLVLAYEFARSSAEESARRLDSIRSRLGYLAAFAGLAVLAGAAIASFGDEPVDLDSALFLVAIGLTCAVVTVAVVVRAMGPSVESARAVYEKHLAEPDAGMLTAMLGHVQDEQERTEGVVSTGRLALFGVSVLFAAEVVLLAVWIPVAH